MTNHEHQDMKELVAWSSRAFLTTASSAENGSMVETHPNSGCTRRRTTKRV